MARTRRSAGTAGALGLGLVSCAVLLWASSCSIINAPDDVDPTAGTGGAGGQGTGAGTNDGGGGGTQQCEDNADCASLTNECATGECSPAGTCIATPQPAGTACGATPSSTCDLADACDGNGTCTPAFVQNGTSCSDCAAGPGNCALCNNGACNDCPARAAQKTFRTPLSASGWQLTGGWAIYSETPPMVTFGPPVPACSDGVDNDSDGLIDVGQDPGCASEEDTNESQPAQCNDGLDNDGDGMIDLADMGCTAIGDDTEIVDGAYAFARPVLGTDGNRKHPYGYNGAGEVEASSATTPPTLIPPQLQFLSWHIDEGSAPYDLKGVQVSLDGISFTNVAVCPENGAPPYPFCEPFTQDRDINDWDPITLDVPPGFAGQIGYVRFIYSTEDGCCNFERGWYVDALNFATDCACASDTDCAYASSECGMGTCDTGSEQCEIIEMNVGDSCTSTASPDCSMPTCDSNGWCASRFLPFERDECESCDDADGQCSICTNGTCNSCPEMQTIDFLDTSGWVFTGDWGYQSCVRANSVTQSGTQPCFPSPQTVQGEPNTTPVFGNDGSRTGVNPFTFAELEVEAGTMVTAPTTIPANLTFKSWHQDRGGNDNFSPRDKKTIRVSTDGGMTWTNIVDCTGNNSTAFCIPSPPNQNRPLDQWDDISIPIPAALVGQQGIFEFSYDTVDSGQGWERGWFIDDFNINRCDCYNLTCKP